MFLFLVHNITNTVYYNARKQYLLCNHIVSVSLKPSKSTVLCIGLVLGAQKLLGTAWLGLLAEI